MSGRLFRCVDHRTPVRSDSLGAGVARCADLLRLVFAAAVIMPACARAATLVGPYPFAVGDTFTFAFQSTETVTDRAGKTTSTEAYTTTTTIGAAIKYNCPPAHTTVVAYPVNTTATATTSAGMLTINNTEYRNFIAAAGGAKTYVLYGFAKTSNIRRPDNVVVHSALTRIYGSPFILDKLPEATGASWSLPINNSDTVDDHYENTGSPPSNVLQSKYVGNTDGSYTDSGKRIDVPYSAAEKADGTGTLDEGPPSATEQWTFALPTAGSGGGEIIPVFVTFEGKTGHNSVPDWFPGHAAAPHPLTASVAIDQGPQTVPSGCGTYAGKTAVRLHTAYRQLGVPGSGATDFDGFTLQQVDDYYVIAGVGRVCVVEARVTNTYDAKVSGAMVGSDVYSSVTSLIKETIH